MLYHLPHSMVGAIYIRLTFSQQKIADAIFYFEYSPKKAILIKSRLLFQSKASR